MLSRRDHDHKMVPTSIHGPSKGKNESSPYASGSLLRSKGVFFSTPSLFSRPVSEEKISKMEKIREKEEKKKLEENRKKLEKQERKKEKERLKMEKKVANVNARTVPRDWNYRVRPIEEVYMKPKLKIRAVPINYIDNPAPHYPAPPPPGRHYATPSVVVRGVHSMPANAPDMVRVQQVYGTSQRRSAPPIPHTDYATSIDMTSSRVHKARVVLLHRSPEGYGFVLRGAKSKLPNGGVINHFTPSAEYPALQYLDSVDPGSQADRAGLKGGDFILEINGENVVRASHEHVVHLMRSSSDVLALKVVTVTHADSIPSDWSVYPDSGAMTLPTRKKLAAPLPPQRDPHTSLSYSKASSRSMAEGLAEIEKLDAAIAQFEGDDFRHHRSLHSLHVADDPKIASVRASHTLKRVSVLNNDTLASGKPRTAAATNSQDDDYSGHGEARLRKNNDKLVSQIMERSKSTPDILAATDQDYKDHYGSKFSESWTKSQAPPLPSQNLYSSATLQPSQARDAARLFGSYGQKKSAPNTPELPQRKPGNYPGPHPTSEIIQIHTGKTATYANVSEEIENRKKMESHYESSFRPGIDAKLLGNPKLAMQKPDQTILKNVHSSNQNGDKNISFADERVMENAYKFLQKYPNANLLVTADIHPNKPDGTEGRDFHEPEPDYNDSDDDKSVNHKTNKFSYNAPVAIEKSKPNGGIYEQPKIDVTDSISVARQSKAAVTVISITSDANKDGNLQTGLSSSHSSPRSTNSSKSSLLPVHMHENTTLTSPAQSLSSSRRSSGVVMATPSQLSSAESSRRSSIQSNLSGDLSDKYSPSSVSTGYTSKSEDNSKYVFQTDVSHPPPGPPPPPPPPPPPLPISSSSQEGTGNSTLRRRSNNVDILPNRISQEDILAAVAQRQNRLETEGPRLLEKVKTLPPNKSTHELNQEALKAAVAKRKSRLEQKDSSLLNEIEARLNQSKMLQAAKYFSSNVNKNQDEDSKKGEEVSKLPHTVIAKPEDQTDSSVLKPANKEAQSDPNKQMSKGTVSPVVPIKSSKNPNKSVTVNDAGKKNSSEQTGNIDFRAHLKPVDVKGTALPSKTSVVADNKAVTKANYSKTSAAPPPLTVSTTSSSMSNSGPTTVISLPAETKSNLTTPLSPNPASGPTSPTGTNMKSTADYISLAEKARMEYLKKKAAGNIKPVVEKKGPVEITPGKKPGQNGPTEDHTHKEQSLSNGTIIKPKQTSDSLLPGKTPAPVTGTRSRAAPPPPIFGDTNRISSAAKEVKPPSSTPSNTSASLGSASRVSISDMIVPPPPPPDFSDFSLGDQDAFIPPPPQFLQIDSNANESKAMNKNHKPFATKPVSIWACVDVLDWLDSLGLHQYRTSFAKACIDGTKLVDMSRNEFLNLGVKQAGHCMNLEQSVKKLNQGVSTNL